jgi:predicted house-cleaning noncanonical NTP pyrophosphatase (MazG superfamily)
MKVHNKLVRDKIPQIVVASGHTPTTHTLDEENYVIELINKLREETAEFAEDLSLEELADVQEVVLALVQAIGETKEALEEVRAQKADERGGFENRIYLECVE